MRIGKDFNADKKKLNLHVGPSGVIEIDEDFTVGEDATITIEGLMIIRKKFDLKRRAKIDIEPNGVLIVVDEFNTENNLQLNIKNSSTAFGRLITISENINLRPSVKVVSGRFYSNNGNINNALPLSQSEISNEPKVFYARAINRRYLNQV